MHHSIRRVGLLCAIVLVPLVLIVIATFPRIAIGASDVADAVDPGTNTPALPSGQVIGNPGYFWNYSAKFVCGVQRLPQPGALNQGEPTVKPGNYATEINFHNYNYKTIVVRKKIILLVDNGVAIGREPPLGQPQGPKNIQIVDLQPDYAAMDDCNALWKLAYPTTPLPTVMPLTIGYLVLISPLDLDVDTVFTAEVPGEINPAVGTGQPTGIAIDVLRVPGKRVYVP